MERTLILTMVVICNMLLLLIIPANVFAQTDLERISVTERSDGKGYVIRFHLTEEADSFRVAHPEPDLIQLMIYSEQLNPEDFTQPRESEAIKNIEYHNNRLGFGVDIILNKGHFYTSLVYPDRNSNHLLIALESSTEDQVQFQNNEASNAK